MDVWKKWRTKSQQDGQPLRQVRNKQCPRHLVSQRQHGHWLAGRRRQSRDAEKQRLRLGRQLEKRRKAVARGLPGKICKPEVCEPELESYLARLERLEQLEQLAR